MKLEVRSSGRPDSEPTDSTRYVRRSFAVVSVYEGAASLAVAVSVAGVLWVFAIAGAFQQDGEKPIPTRDAIGFAIVTFVLVTIVSLFVQLVAGPFVFTRDVVCRDCHVRQRVRRIPFFAGRYSRTPRCGCGGRLEPAMLWEAE